MERSKHADEACQMTESWGKQWEINKSFALHTQESKGWRVAIIGIVFAIIVQIVTFAAMWGELKASVNYNSKTIDRVCAYIDRVTLPKLEK